METIVVELLSKEINNPVMRLPGRKFPGVLIQGDSLKILHSLSEELYKICQAQAISEAAELAAEIKDMLVGRLLIYEAALHAHGLELPYPGPRMPPQNTTT